MTNHVHVIVGSKEKRLDGIFRGLKKFTAKQILNAISKNPKESRKDWMLWMFERAGRKNSSNMKYQFWQNGVHPIAGFL
ncbi:hypothetical protein [Siphonobacter sp. SORGH_AS_0500]|uniref:hypothetical protein n=1 Tax=Siphonobacter sp. SORGH_AS_0500 TaxID=1864824 RepID=UPI00285D1CDA|nr:hypothetical protein [Siphonobacter sp. SORGH_AS_0500]MDR6194490.1 hypothetical protein [Siphonobacter sp. SORGH_AS_0500]